MGIQVIHRQCEDYLIQPYQQYRMTVKATRVARRRVAHSTTPVPCVKNVLRGMNCVGSNVTRRLCRHMKRPCVWIRATSMPGTAKEQPYIIRATIRRLLSAINGPPRLNRAMPLSG